MQLAASNKSSPDVNTRAHNAQHPNNKLDTTTAAPPASLRMILLEEVAEKANGRTSTQMDLVNLNWVKRNLTRFNKEKCGVLHLGWNNPMISTDGKISPAKKDLRITMGVRLKKLKRCTLVASKANHILGCIEGHSWPIMGSYHSSQLSAGEVAH